MKIKNLYIISGAVVLAMITGYVLYRKGENKKLIKKINEILDFEIGQSGTYHDKEEEFKDAAREGSEIPMSEDEVNEYEAMAIKIAEACAFCPGWKIGTDEEAIFDELNKLKSKKDFKKLSYIFKITKFGLVSLYNELDLWDYLNDEFSDKDMEKAVLIIARLK